jgi:polysaccharide biosynthesis transport protein
MSRNFELMQQIDIDRKSRASRTFEPELHVNDRDNNGYAHRLPAGEKVLRLVQQVFLHQTQEPPRVVVFAGIDRGNGCSEICASVAETLAKDAGRPVCLVEANFRSPALSELFGTTNHHGLTDALLQKGPIHSFAKLVAQDNLWLLSSGTLAADSTSLLTSERLREKLDELRRDFDFIVIDAPPLVRYSDAIVLGQLSDGLVLILEADSTRREAASVAVANVRSVKVPILAAVLNKRGLPEKYI